MFLIMNNEQLKEIICNITSFTIPIPIPSHFFPILIHPHHFSISSPSIPSFYPWDLPKIPSHIVHSMTQHPSIHPILTLTPRLLHSRTSPTPCNIYPFCQATSLFSFHIHNIRVTSTSTSNSILLDWVPIIPVLIFFLSFLLVQCSLF